MASFSDRVAIYAFVEKVEFEPSKEAAKSVKIWGAFSLAEGRRGNYYRAAKWGYLGFHLAEGLEDKCLTQWKDLAAVAKTGVCVGFGSRRRQGGLELRHPRQKNAVTFPYSPGIGIRRIRNNQYAPVLSLRSLPRPLTPAHGERLIARKSRSKRPQQRIRLVAENCRDSSDDIRYLFQIHRSSGESIASPPIKAGEGKTSWELDLALEPGERVKWNVYVMRNGLARAPLASSSFIIVDAKR